MWGVGLETMPLPRRVTNEHMRRGATANGGMSRNPIPAIATDGACDLETLGEKYDGHDSPPFPRVRLQCITPLFFCNSKYSNQYLVTIQEQYSPKYKRPS